jgi:hypothetical protein
VALRGQQRTPVLGIAPWGVLSGRARLLRPTIDEIAARIRTRQATRPGPARAAAAAAALRCSAVPGWRTLRPAEPAPSPPEHCPCRRITSTLDIQLKNNP